MRSPGGSADHRQEARVGQPLDAKDGLVPGSLIRYESLTSGIDGKIEFFEYCNAKQNVLAKHHSGCRRTPSENFYRKDFSDIDFLYATIGIFCLCMIEAQK